jgi:hypothetical protein
LFVEEFEVVVLREGLGLDLSRWGGGEASGGLEDDREGETGGTECWDCGGRYVSLWLVAEDRQGELTSPDHSEERLTSEHYRDEFY